MAFNGPLDRILWLGNSTHFILLLLVGCILQFQGGAIPAFRAQSIDGFLAKHYLDGTNVNDWTAVPVDGTFKALHYLGMLLVMAPAAWATQSRPRRDPGTTYLELCMFICAAILISPISWSHYYLFLLLPVAFYAGDLFPRSVRSPGLTRVLGWTFVVSVILFSLPEELSVEYYDAQPEETSLARALLSHYFYGGVLFYLFLVAQRFTGQPRSPS